MRRVRRSSSVMPSAATISFNLSVPLVSVPVLSKNTAHVCQLSNASALLLIRRPLRRDHRPNCQRSCTPNAHGQAITKLLKQLINPEKDPTYKLKNKSNLTPKNGERDKDGWT